MSVTASHWITTQDRSCDPIARRSCVRNEGAVGEEERGLPAVDQDTGNLARLAIPRDVVPFRAGTS